MAMKQSELVWVDFTLPHKTRSIGFAVVGYTTNDVSIAQSHIPVRVVISRVSVIKEKIVYSFDKSLVHIVNQSFPLPYTDSSTGIERAIRIPFTPRDISWDSLFSSQSIPHGIILERDWSVWQEKMQRLRTLQVEHDSKLSMQEPISWLFQEPHAVVLVVNTKNLLLWSAIMTARNTSSNMFFHHTSLARYWASGIDPITDITSKQYFIEDSATGVVRPLITSRQTIYGPFAAIRFLRLISENFTKQALFIENTSVPTLKDVQRYGAIALVVASDVIVAYEYSIMKTKTPRIIFAAAGTGLLFFTVNVKIEAWIVHGSNDVLLKDTDYRELIKKYEHLILKEQVRTVFVPALTKIITTQEQHPLVVIVKEEEVLPITTSSSYVANANTLRRSIMDYFIVDTLAEFRYSVSLLFDYYASGAYANPAQATVYLSILLILDSHQDDLQEYDQYLEEASRRYTALTESVFLDISMYFVLLSKMIRTYNTLGIRQFTLTMNAKKYTWYQDEFIPRILLQSYALTLPDIDNGIPSLIHKVARIEQLNKRLLKGIKTPLPILKVRNQKFVSSMHSKIVDKALNDARLIGVRREATTLPSSFVTAKDSTLTSTSTLTLTLTDHAVVHPLFPLFDSRRGIFERAAIRSVRLHATLATSFPLTSDADTLESRSAVLITYNSVQRVTMVFALFAHIVEDFALFGDEAYSGKLESFPALHLTGWKAFFNNDRYTIVQGVQWSHFLNTVSQNQLPLRVLLTGSTSDEVTSILEATGERAVVVEILSKTKGSYSTPWITADMSDIPSDLVMTIVQAKHGIVPLYTFARNSRTVDVLAWSARDASLKFMDWLLRFSTILKKFRPDHILNWDAISAEEEEEERDIMMYTRSTSDILKSVQTLTGIGDIILNDFTDTNRVFHPQKTYIIFAYIHAKKGNERTFSPSLYLMQVIHDSTTVLYDHSVDIPRKVFEGKESRLLSFSLGFISYNTLPHVLTLEEEDEEEEEDDDEEEDDGKAITATALQYPLPSFARLKCNDLVSLYKLAHYDIDTDSYITRLAQAYTLAADKMTELAATPTQIQDIKWKEVTIEKTVHILMLRAGMIMIPQSEVIRRSDFTANTYRILQRIRNNDAQRIVYIHSPLREREEWYYNIIIKVQRHAWISFTTYENGMPLETQKLEFHPHLESILTKYEKHLRHVYIEDSVYRSKLTSIIVNDFASHASPGTYQLIRKSWIEGTVNTYSQVGISLSDILEMIIAFHASPGSKSVLIRASTIRESARFILDTRPSQPKWWTRCEGALMWWSHHSNKPMFFGDIVKDLDISTMESIPGLGVWDLAQ